MKTWVFTFNGLYMSNYHQHICKHDVQGLLLAKTRDGDYEKVMAITVARGLDRH